MSINEYSEELRNYIRENTIFINDENFQTREEMEKDTTIIEKYIETNLQGDKKCLFFYLSYFIKDDLLRNTIMGNINKNFAEKNIKAREMPDIHYLVVYNISEEDFLNLNIKQIKKYFEDYLKELKLAEEHEEMKRKLEEEARLEEIKEQEEKERFILPKINTCEITNITENSAEILVPFYDEKEIINKNKYNIINCINKYSNTKLEYVIYFYNLPQNRYEKKIFVKNEESKGNKFKMKIDSLEENKIYEFLLGVKFANNYSSPTSNKFYFITKPKEIEGRMFVYGDKKIANNFVQDETHIILPNNKSTYEECFSNDKTLLPLLVGDNVQNMSISDKKTCTVLNEGVVIHAGCVCSSTSEEYTEGNFPENQKFTIDSGDITFEEELPYQISFHNKVKIKKICVGVHHCLALSYSGECYSWGSNEFGQLGLGVNTNEIMGNPKKIKFNIYESDGHPVITEQEPIFYDIAAGDFFSLALGVFNNRQILYYWGNGAGVLDESQRVQSISPKPLVSVENILKIFARNNSIAIICWDKEKRLNVMYIHGTLKFWIDTGMGLFDKPYPVIVNFFRDNNISVLQANFSLYCFSVIGMNTKDSNKIVVYLKGELVNKLYGFKEYKSTFMKLDTPWSEDVISVSPQEKCIFYLLKDGLVKKHYLQKDKLEEKEIRIEGYDLKEYITDDINKVYFQSYLIDNFIAFYQKK